MYEYRPPRENTRAVTVVLILAAASLSLLVTSAFLPAYRVIPQTLAVCLLIPLIEIAARYLVTRYLYRVTPREGGGTDLEIFSYRGGDRMMLVCRVGLDEIVGTAELTESNRKPAHGIHRYNYCRDLAPRNALVLSVRNGDGDSEVMLSPDETLRRMLSGIS